MTWAAVMAPLFGALPNGRAESYTFATIDVPGANFTRAHGINNSGQIVGQYQDTASFATHGYLLSGGNLSTIDFPGVVNTSAQGISDLGQITGYIIGGGAHGFLLSGGRFSTFDAPNFVLTEAYGINDSGQIVGFYVDNSAQRLDHGFLLSGGVFSTIDGPGTSINTTASGINNSGQIVGTYSFSHGFLLSGSVFSTIDVPGSTSTSAIAINNAGQILGSYDDATGGHFFCSAGASSTRSTCPALASLTGSATLARSWGFIRVQTVGPTASSPPQSPNQPPSRCLASAHSVCSAMPGEDGGTLADDEPSRGCRDG